MEENKNQYAHTYDGGVTEKNIEEWKRKHRKVIRIDVVDDNDLHVGYFHRPSLETMAAVAKIGKENELRGAENLFKGCWLGGSEELLNDTVLFLSVMPQLDKAFNSCMSSLKNL